MPELLQDFEHGTIPFPHPFTVWVLSSSFCMEWGSLRAKALEQSSECTIASPLFSGLDTAAAFAQPFRFRDSQGPCQTSGEKGSGTAMFTSFKHEIWNKRSY